MSRYVAVKRLILLALISLFFFFQGMIIKRAYSYADKDQPQNQKKDFREEIVRIESECIAIDSRLSAINKLITRNHIELEKSEQEHARMQEDCSKRLAEIYRNGDITMLEVLLNIKDFNDLLLHISYLQEISQTDLEMLDSSKKKKKQLLSIREELEKSKVEKIDLKRQKTQQLLNLKKKMAEERSFLEKTGIDAQKYVSSKRTVEEEKKQVARSNSAPLGSPVGSKSCTVFPYLGNTSIITSTRMPSDYNATGIKFDGVASWYGNEFNGRPTASGEIFNENDFTCASKTLPFGTFLSVKHGNKHVVVKVTDRGPFVEGRILDLSKAAAKALGISGIRLVSTEIVEPR